MTHAFEDEGEVVMYSPISLVVVAVLVIIVLVLLILRLA